MNRDGAVYQVCPFRDDYGHPVLPSVGKSVRESRAVICESVRLGPVIQDSDDPATRLRCRLKMLLVDGPSKIKDSTCIQKRTGAHCDEVITSDLHARAG